ncbi:IclR family transcriptional regulator [Saccharopolyspora sp. WRP15-2]|uniref:IclR family transcriptional regulator n=1 Tax=Saccharopolyspora oryzae TaxID=2997343 RepID=A0ABT4V2G8_9PSEU|nr:IclR family transcriptional regulator [Saccharopolyspora oryzae]MDA3628170.1 IclR family transcriptional regulator [Saccharopolyspora oryzae]
MARSPSGESVLTRVDRVLSCFDADNTTRTVSEIARHAGLPIATAHRLVNELVSLGYLERTPGRRIRLGVRLWELASRGSRALGLREAARPVMEDLHAVVGHHTQLAVRDGLEALFLERLSTRGGSRNIIRVAGRLPAHACSSGIVLLAHAPVDVQEQLLASTHPRFTDRTPTDPTTLRRLLADTRRRGVVVADGYITVGATGVAVPIWGPRDDVVAALNVVVPSDEGNAPAQISALLAASRSISRALGANPRLDADLTSMPT